MDGDLTHRLAPSGSLRRSVRLFGAFRSEQTDPDRFYSLLAADSVQQVRQWAPLDGRTVLDVGGGPGYFAAAFRGAGATYVAVDADLGEMSARSRPGPGTVLGSGLDLPVRDSAVDVSFSSNVLEHVARPERLVEEMLRVTRPGGVAFVSYMLWLGPHGGHETSPWHYLGGERAARRYQRRYGQPPKNRYGETLFPTSAARMIRWARTQDLADVLTVEPRYHPHWAHWVVRVPGLREVVAWNLLLVLEEAVMLQATQVPQRTSIRERMRLVAACALITALVFQQSPGRVSPDTKLDLVVDPLAFLARSLHLWEPQGFFGQVQNQAYGYLFPMGPFFLLGHLVQLPEWVVQRGWMSLLVCAAFLGTVRLAGAMGIGTPGARLVGALVYALAPRMITVLGAASVEALPMAMAPWVLLPLVRGSVGGSARVAAARSGVAVLLAGGVNAVATAAVLPLPVLYLLTLSKGPRRTALLRWWSAAVVLAVAWWAIPLVLLGRYSPPFLDFIESARVTTLPTNLADTLRGADHWLAYLAAADGPVWRAGWTLVTTPMLILETTVLAGLGLAGLSLRGLAHRSFLVLGLLSGFVLVTSGHVGPVDGLLAHPLLDLMDGPLAPLRNVHKFDPVLRLPLALGVIHLLGRVASLDRARVPRITVAAVFASVIALLAGAAAPALIRELPPKGTFASVPGYWQETADWLAAEGGGRRALLLPASRSGTYYWGDPRDEPLQALARSPWGVRDAVPLAQPGHIRYLDAVERRLVTGRPSDGLASSLARAGVGYLVVRNDLDYARAGSARPVLVHAALAGSPGISRVATFGPPVGGGSSPQGLVDEQLDRPYPAVEIFAVRPSAPVVEAFPMDQAVQVSGGPEAVLELTDREWLDGQPVVLSSDRVPGFEPSRTVITDSLRRREVNFGRLADNVSGVLAPADPLRLGGTARDYLTPEAAAGDRHATTARWRGARAVTSSSASDADAFAASRPEHQPYAALDGVPGTAWLSSGVGGAVGEWFEVRFPRPRQVAGTQLWLDEEAPGPRVTQVRVTTDRGSRTVRIPPGGERTAVVLPPGRTGRLRVTATAVAGGGTGFTFGLRELQVSGLTVARPLRTPADLRAGSTGGPAWVSLAADDLRRPGCTLVGERPLCAGVLARPGAEDLGLDRLVDLPEGGEYRTSVTVQPRAGDALTEMLAGTSGGTEIEASSAAVADPRGSGQAAADRDLGTGWVAATTDEDPTLRVQLPEVRKVTGLQLLVDPALAASRAATVIVRTPEGLRSGDVGSDGVVRFPAVRTDRLEIGFPVVVPQSSYNPYTRQTTYQPVGMSELRVIGADDLRLPAPAERALSTPCGMGPELVLGDQRVQTQVTATRADLVAGRVLRAEPCDAASTTLAAGELRATSLSTPVWSVIGISLVPNLDFPGPVDRLRTTVGTWGTAHRSVEVEARDQAALLVVHENVNAGWQASWQGHRLRPVTVDGWQQGFVLPAGAAGEVSMRFAPDRGYRAGLLVGLLAAALLVGLAVGRWPRGADAPSTGPAQLPWPWVAGVAVIGLAFVGGPWGAVLGVVAVVLGRRARESTLAWLPAVFAVLAAGAAGTALALRPWAGGGTYGGDGWVAPAATLLALAAVVVAWVGDSQARTRPFRFRIGRSTRT